MTVRRTLAAFISLTLFCTSLTAQERKPWLSRTLSNIGTFIDSLSARGIDQRYIEVPEKPWQVMLRFNVNDMDLKSYTLISKEQFAKRGLEGELNWEARVRPHASTNMGLWVGYRGYGLGYSLSISNNTGRNFTIGATGSNFGINLRTRKFNTSEMDVRLWGHDDNGPFELNDMLELYEPVTIRSTIFDAYYMLNGKRFSYAAAYDQSVIQRRSAGSLMLGVMWYSTSLDYVEPYNALLIQALGDVGRTSIQEGSIGVGYAFNWVPTRNLLVNVTAMPMLAVYNRAKVRLYESNYDLFLDEGQTSPTGKKAVPDDKSWMQDITLREVGTSVRHANVSVNIDARLSVTYNIDRYFLNVYGQLNNFKNSIDNNRVRLTDWFVNASLGIRL